jgi:predicted transcriptional regulator
LASWSFSGRFGEIHDKQAIINVNINYNSFNKLIKPIIHSVSSKLMERERNGRVKKVEDLIKYSF